MSFDLTKLKLAFGTPPAGVQLYKRSWLYESTDVLATIQSTGYFNGSDLVTNDEISVTCADATNKVLVVKVDGPTITLVPRFPNIRAVP